RARAAGARIVAAPDAVVNHAIESHTLPGIMRQNLKWRYLAYLVKQHPEIRGDFPLRVFWDRHHMRAFGLLAGVAAGRRFPPALALAAPYAAYALRRRGRSPRARVL